MGLLFSDPIIETTKKTLIYYSEQEQYLGEVKDGLRDGQGVYQYSNGDKYEGGWSGNMKHGFGYFFYNNGELYMGQWGDNKKNGRGMYFYQNGDRFDGEWNQNTKHGQGKFYYVDGRIFDGQFKRSKKNGKGILTLYDGSQYEEIWDEGDKLETKLIKGAAKEEEDWNSPKKQRFDTKRSKNRHQSKKKFKRSRVANYRFDAQNTIQASQYLDQDLVEKNLKEWGDKEVSLWLNKGGFSKYVDNFKQNHIDGKNILDLTFTEFEQELGVDKQDIGRLMKDIDLLRQVYPPNETQSKYVRKKLLKFYQKNKNNVFDMIHRGQNSISKEKGDGKNPNINNTTMNELANEGVNDFIANASDHLKDSVDNQDINDFHSDTSSSSSSDSDSEEEKEIASPLKKPQLLEKAHQKTKQLIPSQVIEEREDEEQRTQKAISKTSLEELEAMKAAAAEKPSIIIDLQEEQTEREEQHTKPLDESKKSVKEPQQIQGNEEKSAKPGFSDGESFQMTEYHTTIDAFKKNDFDLMKTVRQIIGSGSFIDYAQIEVGTKLGEGGYGEVYQGTWLGQDVAIKFYGRKKVKKKDKKIDADFLKEVDVLQQLRHPNIVLFMGVSMTPQYKGLLITEYLEGGSLFEHLHKRATKFSEKDVWKVALDMSLGMEYLHGQGILHCDLKSPNILLAEDDAKLADFGLSSSKARFQKRKKYKRIGTPHWMAPEIMREESYDESSDVYSYGMILWELTAKKIPYWGMKVTQIVGSVGYGDKQVEIPEKGNPTILQIMKLCLKKDRTQRPTFQQISQMLKGELWFQRYHLTTELNAFLGDD